MNFYSKAYTLQQLQNIIECAYILPMVVISRDDTADRNRLKEIISSADMYSDVIVRSSAAEEDVSGNTHAGEFLSISGISGTDEVADAVYKVFESYNKNGHRSCKDDSVFIQPVLRDYQITGVIFTRQPDTGAEYYVVNYSNSDAPDQVTAGYSDDITEYVLYKEKKCSDPQLSAVINAAAELERILECDHLDIEFAIKDGCVYIFQVRKLMINDHLSAEKAVDTEMIKRMLCSESDKRSFAKGKILYGVMPDWNPAELIGIRPKPLTLSLYMKLVTDKAWDIERSRLGYKNITSEPIIKDIYGIPYVDVITSFFSFIPEAVSEKTALKLADFYADVLKKHPEWHDKIEYKVIIDCLYDAPEIIGEKLANAGFTPAECTEITAAVSDLTEKILTDKSYISDKVKTAEKIDEMRKHCLESDMPLTDKMNTLAEITEKYGTVPFSGLARCAFIGTKMLRCFADRGVIGNTEYNDFMKSIHTVSHLMYNDFYTLEKNDFIEKYGFIRPGMYDILSLRYDSENATYFEKNTARTYIPHADPVPDEKMTRRIDDELKRLGLSVSAEDFLKFVTESVKAREYVKFLFSHSVSDLLECIKEYGHDMGISSEDMAYCPFDKLSDPDIRQVIGIEKVVYSDCLRIYLPQLIFDPDDIYEFSTKNCQPSFISCRDISGEIIQPDPSADITGKIVLLESADPGMDWIFTHNILGLITAYGGSNSHMAIRAFEHGIAAAIGVGRTMFRLLLHAKHIRLNCECKKIEVLDIESNIM